MVVRKRKLPEKKEQKQKLPKKAYLRLLFTKPITFRTGEGYRVKISKHVFNNVYKSQPGVGRALAFVIIEGKKIFFYKSTGHNSGMPGAWLPTIGPSHAVNYGSKILREVNEKGALYKPCLGPLVKIEGHPNAKKQCPANFPSWIIEISRKITESERNGSLQFHKGWDEKTFLEIMEEMQKIKFLAG